MTPAKSKPILLVSILDPIGEEGIVRGALVLDRLNKTSITVCTAIANQNDVEIDNITWLSWEEIKRQLDAIGRRYKIGWAVISGVSDLSIVNNIVSYLNLSLPGIKIIWSPAVDKDEAQQLNQQETELFFSLNQTAFLTVCTASILESMLPTYRQSISDLSTLNYNMLLLDTNSSVPSHHLFLSEKQALILSNENAELPKMSHTIFLAALVAALSEEIEVRAACQKAFNVLKSYTIN